MNANAADKPSRSIPLALIVRGIVISPSTTLYLLPFDDTARDPATRYDFEGPRGKVTGSDSALTAVPEPV